MVFFLDSKKYAKENKEFYKNLQNVFQVDNQSKKWKIANCIYTIFGRLSTCAFEWVHHNPPVSAYLDVEVTIKKHVQKCNCYLI